MSRTRFSFYLFLSSHIRNRNAFLHIVSFFAILFIRSSLQFLAFHLNPMSIASFFRLFRIFPSSSFIGAFSSVSSYGNGLRKYTKDE